MLLEITPPPHIAISLLSQASSPLIQGRSSVAGLDQRPLTLRQGAVPHSPIHSLVPVIIHAVSLFAPNASTFPLPLALPHTPTKPGKQRSAFQRSFETLPPHSHCSSILCRLPSFILPLSPVGCSLCRLPRVCARASSLPTPQSHKITPLAACLPRCVAL